MKFIKTIVLFLILSLSSCYSSYKEWKRESKHTERIHKSIKEGKKDIDTVEAEFLYELSVEHRRLGGGNYVLFDSNYNISKMYESYYKIMSVFDTSKYYDYASVRRLGRESNQLSVYSFNNGQSYIKLFGTNNYRRVRLKLVVCDIGKQIQWVPSIRNTIFLNGDEANKLSFVERKVKTFLILGVMDVEWK